MVMDPVSLAVAVAALVTAIVAYQKSGRCDEGCTPEERKARCDHEMVESPVRFERKVVGKVSVCKKCRYHEEFRIEGWQHGAALQDRGADEKRKAKGNADPV